MEQNTIKTELALADQALTSAEESLDNGAGAAEVLQQVQKSATLLLRTFIRYKGEEPLSQSLKACWSQCLSLESEFAELEETVEYLLVDEPAEDLDEEDLGEIVDATNEIWDFVIGFFPEEVLP